MGTVRRTTRILSAGYLRSGWAELLLALATALTVPLGLTGPVHAATFTVTNTNDSGPGSLRQAIADASGNTEGDTIDIAATGTINLQSGLVISDDVQVNGPGADKLAVRRDTGGNYPILKIFSSDVTIGGLTIANGNGGCCDVGGLANIDNSGGHSLTLRSVAVSGNEATTGGGIHNSATLALISSTVSGNTAVHGGGIRNDGTLTLSNSTVSGNTATGDQSVPGMGGGILNYGALKIANSTLSENTGSYGANVYTQSSTSPTLANTIVANPQVMPSSQGAGFGCFGAITSLGHNLDEDSSCVEPVQGDVVGQDSKLGPLQNNGGPTQTHALLAGSPALDTAETSACPQTDQRAKKRDDGNNDGSSLCDIGAYERQVGPRAIKVTPSNAQKGVSPRANVYATFSEAMNANTLRNATTSRSATFKLARRNVDGTTTQVAAKVTYYAASNRAVLNPDNDLRLGTTYVATVTTGAKDLAGNALDQSPATAGNQTKVWRFTVKR